MNPELKENILKNLASTFIDLNMYGIIDQYPINVAFVYPNLLGFREDIFLAIEKNINNYSEVMLSQILQLLSYRGLKTTSEIFNLVLDELIKKRKDPTLESSLELTYSKELKDEEITNFSSFKKYILWAEINTDIEYPIFRGFGFNVYVVGERLYKEYNLSTGRFVYSCNINDNPQYYITGHNKKPGFLNDYKFYGALPSIPRHPIFSDDVEKIEYTINKILHHLGVNKKIKKEDITIDISINTTINQDISDEEKEKEIEVIYNYLREISNI